MTPKNPKLSIIISTHNRAELLNHCLDSLIHQSATSYDYQIIVVNNACTDHTDEVVARYQSTHTHPAIHLTHHNHLGLSYARNHGSSQATGQYLAFIDDDATADTNWVKNIIHYSQSQPAIFGGPILPNFTSPKPPWFRDSYETRTHGNKPKKLNKHQFLSGSNLIINRELFIQLNKFNPQLGVTGPVRTVGEETDLQTRARKIYQVSIQYFPDLLIHHLVPTHKMTLKYRFTSTILAGYSGKPTNRLKTFLRSLFAIGQLLVAASLIPFRNQHLYPYPQNYLWEVIAPHLFWLGRAARALKP